MSPAELFLAQKGAKTEAALAGYLARYTAAPQRLIDAMRYSLLAPAKRLRPALALGACEVIRGDDATALPAACAIEMIHTYSLIHDDLPSMDNDTMRRGQASCHVAFGEALAILAGDALLTLAFEILAEAGNVAVIAEIAKAAGPHGMAGGQTVDLEAEHRTLPLAELESMHRMKTGALISGSVRVGSILGGANFAEFQSLTAYGGHLGLAFQITDDLLDVRGTAQAMGKSIGKDAQQGKSTFTALLGIEGARRAARVAVDSAISSLSSFSLCADSLRALAEYTLVRNR